MLIGSNETMMAVVTACMAAAELSIEDEATQTQTEQEEGQAHKAEFAAPTYGTIPTAV